MQGGEAVRTKDAGCVAWRFDKALMTERLKRAISSGTEWIASTVADMSLGCRMRRSAYAAAARHKAFLSRASDLNLAVSCPGF